MTVDLLGKIINIMTCSAIAAVVLLVEHLALRRRLAAPWNYVAGVLGFGVPYGVLLAFWGSWLELVAFVAVVACAGGVVLAGYDFRVRDENKKLRKDVNEAARLVMESRGGKRDGGGG